MSGVTIQDNGDTERLADYLHGRDVDFELKNDAYIHEATVDAVFPDGTVIITHEGVRARIDLGAVHYITVLS